MCVSIYYDALRGYPLSIDENNIIGGIVGKYNREKLPECTNDFGVDEYNPEYPELIFSGATDLAETTNPIVIAIGCHYWARCLSEIKENVDGADWTVQMDDDDLIWDNNKGWNHEMFEYI